MIVPTEETRLELPHLQILPEAPSQDAAFRSCRSLASMGRPFSHGPRFALAGGSLELISARQQ